MKINWLYVVLLVIFCIICLMFILSQQLKREFRSEVRFGINNTKISSTKMITEKDLAHLPELVANYLRYVGVVGKEKVNYFKAEFTGNIRSNPEDDWMKLNSIQYNFIRNPMRLFYIKAKKMGIPALGLHKFKEGKAIMDIRMLGLFRISYADGPEMDQSETVTFFNDMCIMAPATLIDERIAWETIDDQSVEARFTNKGITISAKLIFNEKGQLINFISNDRYEAQGNGVFKQYPWSTPLSNYREINGYNLAGFGAAVSHHPDKEFTYAEFTIEDVCYNMKADR